MRRHKPPPRLPTLTSQPVRRRQRTTARSNRCWSTSCSHCNAFNRSVPTSSRALTFCSVSTSCLYSSRSLCSRSTSASACFSGSLIRLFSCAISNMSFSSLASVFFISATSSFKDLMRSRLLGGRHAARCEVARCNAERGTLPAATTQTIQPSERARHGRSFQRTPASSTHLCVMSL